MKREHVYEAGSMHQKPFRSLSWKNRHWELCHASCIQIGATENRSKSTELNPAITIRAHIHVKMQRIQSSDKSSLKKQLEHKHTYPTKIHHTKKIALVQRGGTSERRWISSFEIGRKKQTTSKILQQNQDRCIGMFFQDNNILIHFRLVLTILTHSLGTETNIKTASRSHCYTSKLTHYFRPFYQNSGNYHPKTKPCEIENLEKYSTGGPGGFSDFIKRVNLLGLQ